MPLPSPAAPSDGARAPLLAGGAEGAAALRPLTGVAADALEQGAARLNCPLRAVAAAADPAASVLGPYTGRGDPRSLPALVRDALPPAQTSPAASGSSPSPSPSPSSSPLPSPPLPRAATAAGIISTARSRLS